MKPSKSFSRSFSCAVLVCAGLLIANAGAALPEIAGPDTYPRSPQAVELKRGTQTVRVRPLRTVRTIDNHEALADRLVVAFKAKNLEADQLISHNRARSLGAGLAKPLLKLAPRTILVDVTGAASLEAAARAYLSDPDVKGASPDWVMHTNEIPNDPLIGNQGNLNVIQAPAAWNRTHAFSGVRIAILDSGIDETHPELSGKVVARADFTGAGNAADANGHGTHVAGIAAAATNNALGVAGVGYDSRLLNVRVLDATGRGSVSMLSKGIRWAREQGAHVINMSIGSDQDCNPTWAEQWLDILRDELRDQINAAFAANIVLVAAAGNDGADKQQWPGACPNVLAVANTTNADAKASSSNFGAWVDVAAPGSGILSTAMLGASACGATLSGRFGQCSGTSMASPHVAGLAALVRASCGLTTSPAIVARITGNTDLIPGTGTLWRFGRINALRAACFPVPSSLRVGNVTSSSIQLLWSDTTPGENRFELSRQPVGGAAQILTLPANSTSFVDSGLSSSATIDYKLRACDAFGCSNFSQTLRARPGARLTVSKLGSGKVTAVGINCGGLSSDCNEVYPSGTSVTVKATPINNPGAKVMWSFDHWEGACSGFDDSCTVSMNGSKSARAVFISQSIEDPVP